MSEYIRENFSVAKNGDIYTITPHLAGDYCAYVSESAGFFDKTNCLGRFSGEVTVELGGNKRVYFHLVGDGARYDVAAARVVDVEGMSNIRDLGGYNTTTGAAVKYGVFFRSERLCDATPAGLERIKELGLRFIADYREEEALKQYADPVIPGAVYSRKSAMVLSKAEIDFTFDKIGTMTPEEIDEVKRASIGQYDKMPFNSEAYRELFAVLLEGRVPMLFHCTAGKDRTGIAAALILGALGVPYETIEYDYLLSRELRRERREKRIAELRARGTCQQGMDLLETVMSVDESYLARSAALIKERYSSFSDYLRAEFGVDAAARERLKQLYLMRR